MKFWKLLFGPLFLILVLIAIMLFEVPDNKLHIIACDVGQGDAILIVYKNVQILTDGGPDKKVLSCLSKYLPFWDRQIELVISTHPDADHVTGLVDVMRRYNVDKILINPIDPSTQVYKALEKEVGRGRVSIVLPVSGLRLRIDLIYLDILHPFKGFESKETNAYSIVYKLKYEDFEAIMTGDINSEISDEIVERNNIESVEYIKVPHHGSRNGMTENLLKALVPKIAVISSGKNNSFGHPHKEIVDMLNKYGVKIFRTDEKGDIEIETNGKEFWVKR